MTFPFSFCSEISNIENINQLLHGSGTFVEGGALVVGQADLDDLFDAVFAQLYQIGRAHV